MSERPPPYQPFFPEGPSPSSFPPAFCSPPAAFPSTAYQTFPQSFQGDQTFYTQQGTSVAPPGYPGDHHGNKLEGPHLPKQTVYMVGQRPHQEGGVASYLAACSAALCCCCLWDLLHR